MRENAREAADKAERPRSPRPADVEIAVREALRLGAIGVDAVKHLLLCRLERRPPRLDLEFYPYLPRAEVATTSAGSYMTLLSRAES